MTRINLIDPKLLTDKHLMAEARELTRIPNTINSGKANISKENLAKAPKEYVLGTGHVSMFYNKLKFLHKRYNSLYKELLERGYAITHTFPESVPESLYGDYTPTKEAVKLNIERILERFPKDGKMGKEVISKEDYQQILEAEYGR